MKFLNVQGHQAKIVAGMVSSYFLLRLVKLNFVSTFLKMVHEKLPYVVQTLGAASSPFACISSSLNKPTPLKLDVSFPSFQHIKWSFSRLLYLFNVQVERNFAT